MLHFDTPLALLLLALFPFALEAESRRAVFSMLGWTRPVDTAPAAVAFSSPVSLAAVISAEGTIRRTHVLNVLRLLTFLLLVIALARPQTSSEYTEIETSGRDIMLALDISGSMHALDFTLNGEHVERLTALKSVVKEFLEERKGDRIGLVIFGTEVFTQCPLTADHRILSDFVDRLEIGMVGEGTALGDAVALSVKRLRDVPGQSKVIVLVTDGVRTAGTIDPKEAAQIAKKENIKVYTIGIGGTKRAPFKVPSPFGGETIQYVDVPLDVATLQAIADISGAKFFRAEKTDALRNVYQEINRLEERIESQTEFVEYQERFVPFLIAALCCFLLHRLLCSTRYLVIP